MRRTAVIGAIFILSLVGCDRTARCSQIARQLERPGVRLAVEEWVDKTFRDWNRNGRKEWDGGFGPIGELPIVERIDSLPIKFTDEPVVRLRVNGKYEPSSMFVGDRGTQGIIVLLQGSNEVGIPSPPDRELRIISKRIRQVCLVR